MRRLILALLVASAAPLAAFAQSWSEYRPAGGRYQIEMPGTPTVSKEDIALDGGRTAVQIQASVEGHETIYIAGYVDYPADVTRGVPPATLLERMRDGVIANRKVRRDTALTIGGAPAREIVVVDKDGLALITRGIWANNRLFQVLVAGVDGTDGVENRANTKRFLDSFKLVTP